MHGMNTVAQNFLKDDKMLNFRPTKIKNADLLT